MRTPEEQFAQSLLIKQGESPKSEESEDEESQSLEGEETIDPKEEPVSSESKSNIFDHHSTHPITLSAVLLSKYGYQWLDWEPETLWQEIKDDFNSVISVHNRNKIQAVKTCHVVSTPWKRWEVFSVVVMAFTNNVPNFR
ncbi:MAG: hypothetical protein ACXAEU_22950, partial [Candidatus Hodarchaeales archaeon]